MSGAALAPNNAASDSNTENTPVSVRGSAGTVRSGGGRAENGRRGETPDTRNSEANVAADGEEEDQDVQAPSALDGAIFPLFLTAATQELFHLKIKEHVTVETPHKAIPKADLIQDMMTRAAISDFSPAKKVITEYPLDEIILIYDADWKYGQNFYLLTTPEAVEEYFRITLDEKSFVATQEPPKPPRPAGWVSLGSDKEIDAEKCLPTRAQIHIKVSRRRREFGSPCKFSDRDAHDGLLECKPYKDASFELMRAELNMGIQAVPFLRDNSAQTEWFRPVNFASQYEPLEINPESCEQILNSTDLEEFLKRVLPRFDSALQLNEIVDIFADDYAQLGDDDVALEQGAQTALREYQSFTDLKHSKDKSISCVEWHPSQRGVIAISCSSRLTFDEKVEAGYNIRSKQSLILIWSFNDPIHPQLILEAPDDINCFQFNPSEPHLIAGGCANGQIVLWDISDHSEKLKVNRRNKDSETMLKDEKPVETSIIKYMVVSSIEFSHRAAITDLMWLPKHFELNTHTAEILENGENGTRQLVTTSLDGQVYFWDIRYRKELKALDLVWKPFWRIPLAAADSSDYGLTKISLCTTTTERSSNKIAASETALNERPPSSEKSEKGTDKKSADKKTERVGSTKFFCASEEGDLLYSDWTREKTSDEKSSLVEFSYPSHFGAMSDLQRSPFFPDILLSVGGWTFHIWREKVTAGPILSSSPTNTYLTAGKWSPSRPGVFFIGKADGNIEIWDLLDRSHLPSHVQNISSTAISQMSVHHYSGKTHSSRQFIAAGDDDGALHILEVPRNLTKPAKNEKAFIRGFFDREVKRLLYVRERKAIRAKAKEKVDAVPVAAEPGTMIKPEVVAKAEDGAQELSPEDVELMKYEKQYLAMEAQFLQAL